MYHFKTNAINKSDNNTTFSNLCQTDGNDTLDSSETEIINNISITRKSITNTFRIIEANINSLKGKKEDLSALIENEKPDCLILVETKLDDSHQNSEFFDLNTWNVVVRQDRNCYGGGVIIAVRRKFIVTPVNIEYKNKDSNPELYWIKLHTIRKQKPIYICGFYRSQRDTRSSDTISCLRESLLKLPGKKGQQHVVLVGDANLHINWETNHPHSAQWGHRHTFNFFGSISSLFPAFWN